MAINQSWTESGLAGPYKELFYTYPEEDSRLQQDAMNRARQFGAQSAAARGQKSPRGAALNTYNRIGSDYTTYKAATDRANRLAYTGAMTNMMRAGTQPSTWSQILGPLGAATAQGIGQAAGQPIVSGITEGVKKIGKKVGDWWESSPQQISQEYEALRGGQFGYGDQPYGEMPGMGYQPYSSLGDVGDLGQAGMYGAEPTPDWTYGATDMMPYASVADYAPATDWTYGVTDVMPW